MTKTLYITEGGRLAGIQDVSTWTSRAIDKALTALKSIRREGDVSEHGRSVCCACGLDLGPKEGIKAGQVSHGYCPKCYSKKLKEIGGDKMKYIKYAVIDKRCKLIGEIEAREDQSPIEAAKDFYGKRAKSVYEIKAEGR